MEVFHISVGDIPPVSDDTAEQWGRDHGIEPPTPNGVL